MFTSSELVVATTTSVLSIRARRRTPAVEPLPAMTSMSSAPRSSRAFDASDSTSDTS
jgi:hypothetical protein